MEKLMSNKASVLMIVSKYRIAGGHETVIDSLCEGLGKLGHKMAIGAYSFERDPPAGIGKVSLNKSYNPISKVNDFDVDIIHSHQTIMNYCSLFAHEPFLFHYHGAPSIIQKINLKTSFSFLGNKISAIIAISNAGLSDFRRLVPWNKVPKNVVYNGVNAKALNVRLPRPYTKGDPQLLFVGHLYRTKNVIKIIHDMPRILRIYPNAHLQIVGSGEDSRRIQRAINERELESKVELTGSVSSEDLIRRYSSCDIYISASKWEMFALPVLEAMACGKPVVVSDIPAHKELLEASNAGKAFSLDTENDILHSIRLVYDNRESLSLAAREFAMRCDWSRACTKVSEIYSQILTDNTKRIGFSGT